MKKVVLLCGLLGGSVLMYGQDWEDHSTLRRLDNWYADGDYERILDKAEDWRKADRNNAPPSWVYSLYRAKAYFALTEQSTGRARANYLRKGTSLLRSIRRKYRTQPWQEWDSTLIAESKDILEAEAQTALNAMNTERAYQQLRALAEIYQDTTTMYRLLEDEDYLYEYTTNERTNPHEIFPHLLLNYVNQLRSEGCNCGGEWMPPVGPLTWNDTLQRTGELHSLDMETQGYFDHTGQDGSKPWDRAKRLGFRSGMMGENIALGYHTELSVFRGWKASPGHCKNMMRSGYTIFGVGRSGTYWTMLLAHQ